jgi:hypothetical protein
MLSWRGKFAAQPHGPRNRRAVVVPAQLRQILTRANAELADKAWTSLAMILASNTTHSSA